MARKIALIIANSQYEDAQLSKLAAPDVDARALAEILETPSICGFDEVQLTGVIRDCNFFDGGRIAESRTQCHQARRNGLE